MGPIIETIDRSDGVLRSAIVPPNDRVYKRPLVKLTSILASRDVFAIENRVGDVVAELTESTTELISASRRNQALNIDLFMSVNFSIQ